jgi:alpha-1,2-mannosyltransferase
VQKTQLRSRPLPTWVAALAFAGAVGLYLLYRSHIAPKSVDLAVYQATGEALLHGGNIYGNLHLFDGLRATYPPFAAVVFVPLTLLPLVSLQYVLLAVNEAMLVLIAVLTCRLLAVEPARRLPMALLAAAAGTLCEPVVTTMNLGQINLVLVALILVDLVRDEGAPLRGVGIGLATAIKLTAGLFIVYLLLTRRYREAVVASVTFVAATAIGWLIIPGPSREYWTNLVFDERRIGLVARPDNQSLAGLLARFMHAPDAGAVGTAIVVIVGVVGLGVACLAYRRLGEAWGAMACAFTALLVSPISWTHHWVWCVPVALVLWVDARRWSITVLIFWTYLVLVPHNGFTHLVHYGPGTTLISGSYAYFAILLLALTAHRAWRSAARGTGEPKLRTASNAL